MKKLTKKENEIMDLFWKHGPMFVRELRELYPEPRPHVNTLSTGVVSSCFSNSYLRAVSTLVQEEKISVDELKQLIEQIESAHKR